MIKLASLKIELLKFLKTADCTFVRNGRGDHQIWYSPISKINFTGDLGITSRNMANVILKQAGLEKKF
jgi:hypothetical protein